METNPITNKRLHVSSNLYICSSIWSIRLIYKQCLYMVFCECAANRRDGERGSHIREKREQPRGSRLEKKKAAKRELCMENKIERKNQSVATFERNN